MNQTCPLLITLFPLLTLLLLLEKSLSIDPDYEACKPLECGSLSISYPFYVQDKLSSFCGSEGFEVSCNNKNQTVIKLSGDDYIINNISYQDLTVNIINTAFTSSFLSCSLSSVHNLTMEDDGKFNFTSKHKYIRLLKNCSRSRSTKYTEIKCEEHEHQGELLPVYEEDFNTEKFGKCKEAVQVPHDEEYEAEHASANDIEGLLRKGILLKYTANNCSVCQHSGGRCGYNPSKKFICFCPDRPHRSRCHHTLFSLPCFFDLVHMLGS